MFGRFQLAAIILLCIFCPPPTLVSQDMMMLQDSMRSLAPQIRYSPTDPERFASNDLFMKVLDDALAMDHKMKHNWDSIEGISILSSPDKRCRIFSWFVPLTDGTYQYFGVIQSFDNRHGRYNSHWLQDHSSQITQPEQALLNADNWFGAMYYEMIPVESGQTTYYTLLGWDGNDNISRRRIIEVLTLRSNGSPVFGYYLFRHKGQKNRRVIMEYSGQSQMMLKFDKQTYIQKIRQKGKGLVEKPITKDMIVFDRLIPMHPSMEGQFAFYVPETNIVDAYVFENGRWNYVANIDARNPVRRDKKAPSRPTRLELLPRP